jgi:hypothetical protein
VKYNYCAKCDKAYVKSRLEKDSCIYCGSGCETVDVKRNGLYYIGYAIMLGGAASAMVPRIIEVQGTNLYIGLGIVLLVAGIVFIMKGGAKMAEAAKKLALEQMDQ